MNSESSPLFTELDEKLGLAFLDHDVEAIYYLLQDAKLIVFKYLRYGSTEMTEEELLKYLYNFEQCLVSHEQTSQLLAKPSSVGVLVGWQMLIHCAPDNPIMCCNEMAWGVEDLD